MPTATTARDAPAQARRRSRRVRQVRPTLRATAEDDPRALLPGHGTRRPSRSRSRSGAKIRNGRAQVPRRHPQANAARTNHWLQSWHMACVHDAVQHQRRIICGLDRIDRGRRSSEGVARSVPGVSGGDLLVPDRRIPKNVSSMRVDADESRIAIRLEAKPGVELDVSESRVVWITRAVGWNGRAEATVWEVDPTSNPVLRASSRNGLPSCWLRTTQPFVLPGPGLGGSKRLDPRRAHASIARPLGRGGQQEGGGDCTCYS